MKCFACPQQLAETSDGLNSDVALAWNLKHWTNVAFRASPADYARKPEIVGLARKESYSTLLDEPRDETPTFTKSEH